MTAPSDFNFSVSSDFKTKLAAPLDLQSSEADISKKAQRRYSAWFVSSTLITRSVIAAKSEEQDLDGRMHESVFSYTLSRPYPYRWFTYIVWLGGAAALALFSVVSLAANGYTTRYDPRKMILF